MIQHHDCPGQIKKILTLCITWFVCIHHNHNCIIIHKILCLGTIYKHGRLIIRIIDITCHQRTDGCGRIIYYNMNRLAKGLSCTINTDCSPKGIYICDLMSHNHNTILGAHKLFQSLCLHSGLYAGIFLHLLGFSAKIGDGISILNYYLVTAASKSHLNGNTAIFIILQIVCAVQTNTDT